MVRTGRSQPAQASKMVGPQNFLPVGVEGKLKLEVQRFHELTGSNRKKTFARQTCRCEHTCTARQALSFEKVCTNRKQEFGFFPMRRVVPTGRSQPAQASEINGELVGLQKFHSSEERPLTRLTNFSNRKSWGPRALS